MSFCFGLVGLHFLAFWPFGPSFPCILAFWAFISLHFGLLGLHFLAFWLFWGSACVLAFWAFLSLHFGFLGLHFLAFWPFGPSFPCILAFWGSASGAPPPPTSCQKRSVFPMSHTKNLSAPGPAPFCNFLPSGPSFHFILAVWAFISLHFGLLGFDFLSFWRFGPSFPCILPFWAFISLHFGFLGLDFLAFWRFGGQLVGPPYKLPKWPVCLISRTKNLVAPGPAPFCNFWPFGPSFPLFLPYKPAFPCILAFWALLGLALTFRACNFDRTASGQTQAIARARTHSFFDAGDGALAAEPGGPCAFSGGDFDQPASGQTHAVARARHSSAVNMGAEAWAIKPFENYNFPAVALTSPPAGRPPSLPDLCTLLLCIVCR